MLGAVNNMSAIESEISEHANELLAIVKAPRDILALQLRRLQVCCSLVVQSPIGRPPPLLSTQRWLTPQHSTARCALTFSLKHRSAAAALALSRASSLPLKQCKLRAFRERRLEGVWERHCFLILTLRGRAAQFSNSTPDQTLPFCWNAEKQLFEHR